MDRVSQNVQVIPVIQRGGKEKKEKRKETNGRVGSLQSLYQELQLLLALHVNKYVVL